ncbi:unnamed protein product [Cyclocybe aegerita]|uniref:RING-type domain-containing protein n=1 Tax=Cyclocybe aegerita TaxID=1973307 RepID=A0A8S0X3S2_CYCAE|nr:unnamed protein product [Cyclocybe aegerita]
MPVLTRQPTPGTSAAVSPLNEPNPTKKRPGSEIAEERRDAKKLKVDGQPNVNGRDKKKKKKKKKKKPVVAQARDALTQQRPRSTSQSVPLSTSRHVASNGGVNRTEEVGTVLEVEDHREVESSSRSPDKGKDKARENSTPRRSPPPPEGAPPSHAEATVASGSGSSHAISSEPLDQALEIARLKEQLEEKSRLLDRHQAHLNHHHQALTCQICLDLLHKPYALNPCGHITCYGCLVRWFTASQNPNEAGGANGPPPPEQGQGDDVETILDSASARLGNYLRRRKTCPVCRAAVHDRPVEIWGIKSMVASLLRSGLVDAPAPAPAPAPPTPAVEGPANAITDPWRNVFQNGGARRHPAHQHAPFGIHPLPPPAAQDDGDREQLGWYDAEDGGIYRCIECYHEIWDGVCSGCHRAYPGHDRGDDDDDFDDFDDDDDDGPGFMAEVARYFDEEDDEEDYDLDLEEPDHIWGVPLYDDDDDEDDDDDGDLNPRYHYRPFGGGHAQPIELTDEEEDEFDVHVGAVRNWFRNNPDAPPDHRNNGIARIEEVHDVDEEEDEEDSQYGGSFIDDEAAEDARNGDLHEDNDDEDVVVEQVVIHDQPPRRRRPVPARRRNAVIEISDDDDEGGEDDDEAMLRRPLRLTTRPHVIQDDDDEDAEGDSEEDGESLRSVSPIPMRAARARARRLPSDDEDDDD